MSMKHGNSVSAVTEKNVKTVSKLEQSFHDKRTFGERMADGIANGIGSWTFIVIQGVLLIIWMTLNVAAWLNHWDPYPFVLLNLALSFQSAFAGPVIMMSQKRQGKMLERRDHLDLQ